MNQLRTEKEWLATTEANKLIRFAAKQAESPASERKFRLIELAYAQRFLPLLTESQSREALAVAERFVEGLTDEREVWKANEASDRAYMNLHTRLGNDDPKTFAAQIANCVVWHSRRSAWQDVIRTLGYLNRYSIQKVLNPVEQAAIARDVLGNPFQPQRIEPEWLTPAVTGLANDAYTQRAFDLLPILADALEDAGCDESAILEHCRSDGIHVRGCWVLDLLLAKS